MWDLGEGARTRSKEVETELAFLPILKWIGSVTAPSSRTVGAIGYPLQGEPLRELRTRNSCLVFQHPTATSTSVSVLGLPGIRAARRGALHGVLSAEVAKRNSTVLVLNTELTDRAFSKVNGKHRGKPQAFKLIKLVEPEPTTV